MVLPQLRLPDHTQRLTIVGRNGSGKSTFGVWALSEGANFDKRPWIIIDYKYEILFRDARVKHLIKEIKPTSSIPKRAGLYIVHPRPDEGEDMEQMLWRIWERGRTGVFVDEGYMLPDHGAFQALLTQGRSKHIPMIILSQRPVEMNRFVFSEANYFSLFNLNDRRDWETVERFTAGIDGKIRLPPYHSWWYDTAQDATFRLAPVPGSDSILRRIAERAPRRLWS